MIGPIFASHWKEHPDSVLIQQRILVNGHGSQNVSLAFFRKKDIPAVIEALKNYDKKEKKSGLTIFEYNVQRKSLIDNEMYEEVNLLDKKYKKYHSQITKNN
jgi:hypothetical protein